MPWALPQVVAAKVESLIISVLQECPKQGPMGNQGPEGTLAAGQTRSPGKQAEVSAGGRLSRPFESPLSPGLPPIADLIFGCPSLDSFPRAPQDPQAGGGGRSKGRRPDKGT